MRIELTYQAWKACILTVELTLLTTGGSGWSRTSIVYHYGRDLQSRTTPPSSLHSQIFGNPFCYLAIYRSSMLLELLTKLLLRKSIYF